MRLNLIPEQVVAGLRHLYPGINLLDDAQVLAEPEGIRLVWHLPGPPPTEAELLAAAAAGQSRADHLADLAQAQAMLDDRYRLYTRALATDNALAQLELREEIQMLLDYLKEVRDAAYPA